MRADGKKLKALGSFFKDFYDYFMINMIVRLLCNYDLFFSTDRDTILSVVRVRCNFSRNSIDLIAVLNIFDPHSREFTANATRSSRLPFKNKNISLCTLRIQIAVRRRRMQSDRQSSLSYLRIE